jgi:hypothetical protein
MQTLRDAVIRRAWRHRGEEGRIHFIVSTPTAGERRLWISDASELGQVLAAELEALGYTGPAEEPPSEGT